jgi:hypothetical protein
MSDRMFERAVRDWLDDGSDRTPRHAIDAVLLAVKTTPQERALRIPRRFTLMPTYLRLAAVAAVVAVVGVGAMTFFGGNPGAGGPTATPTSAPTSNPTAEPSVPAPTFTTDISKWTPYSSAIYELTTAYPPGWKLLQRAARAFDPAIDMPLAADPENAYEDAFTNDVGDVAFSVWQVPIEENSLTNDQAALLDWIEQFCSSMGYFTPCDGIAERAIPMCRERADCHPDAVIVPFSGDTLAFFDADDAVTIAQVWRADADPEVAEFGGATALLKAFLETMNVFPAPAPG